MPLFIKNISLYNLIKLLAIVYLTSLANLVVEVGTRHSHQIFAYLIKKSVWTGIDAFPMGAGGRADCVDLAPCRWAPFSPLGIAHQPSALAVNTVKCAG